MCSGYPAKGHRPPNRHTSRSCTTTTTSTSPSVRSTLSLPDITVRSGRRDQFIGDVVGINFDSYHDHRTGFEFNLTAAGQKIDLVLTNINWDVNWNAVWSGKTAFEDSAWTAEFRIPLSQLRYSSDSVQVWGMHAWRWIDRLQEESDWEPQSSTGPGALYLFGELQGLAGLPVAATHRDHAIRRDPSEDLSP